MNYVQMRENEKINKSTNKEFAIQSHSKNIEARVLKYAANICKKYDLPERMKNNIAALIFADYDNAKLLPNKIETILNLLSKYGYDVKTLENNFPLLKHSTSDLLNALSIANQYGFDEEILAHYSFYSTSTAKEIYSLTEELKQNGVNPDYETVNKLYIKYNNAGKLKKLNELHPMNEIRIKVYRTLYDRKLKESESKKTLVK